MDVVILDACIQIFSHLTLQVHSHKQKHKQKNTGCSTKESWDQGMNPKLWVSSNFHSSFSPISISGKFEIPFEYGNITKILYLILSYAISNFAMPILV